MRQAPGKLKRNRSVSAVLELELITASLGRQAYRQPSYTYVYVLKEMGENHLPPLGEGQRRLHRAANI